MVIPNCGITHQDSEVLKQCVMSQRDPLYKIYNEYHTGVDLSASNVFSLYDGTIVSIGSTSQGHSVIIQTGVSLCICYKYLQVPKELMEGDTVSAGQQLGTVDKYVHVELLTKTKSNWPVRIGRDTWYKNDITSLIEDSKSASYVAQPIYFSDMGIFETSDYPNGRTDIIDDTSRYILTDNKGA